MIIILEGPDGSGKTTLARRLQEDFDLEYHHEGPPPDDENTLHYYGRVLDSYYGRRVVIDRFALGETVYGPILRSTNGLGPHGWPVFQRLAQGMGARQIICLPPPRLCHENWVNSKKTELFSDDSVFWRVYSEYAFRATRKRLLFHVYDYTEESYEELVHGWNERPVLPRGVIGSLLARYLIVGERANGSLDLPFFSTSGSSAYLSRALCLADFSEHELMWMNARDASDNVNALPLRSADGCKLKVIALGKKAAEACRGREHVELPHPQYWKRFHHHDIDEYVRALKEARA